MQRFGLGRWFGGWVLHDLVTCLAAPCIVLSGADGQLRQRGAQGAFVADVRVLSEAVVLFDGLEGDPVSSSARGAGRAEFVAVIRSLGDAGPDPTVWLRRRRSAEKAGLREDLTVVNRSAAEVRTAISVRVAADLVEIESVKAGLPSAAAQASVVANGVRYGSGRLTVQLDFPGAQLRSSEDGAVAEWPVTIDPRSEVTLSWSLRVQDRDAIVVPAANPPAAPLPGISADDRRLAPFVIDSVSDLRALRMSLATHPEEEFVAAGSPWYLTLFGRDSIWAARMALPLGTELAAGTLRTLAAVQGRVVDAANDEEPGKILHELRRSTTTLAHTSLPPIYYGTVDATPLWVCLLADAWRWGMPPGEVRALLPAMERAGLDGRPR